MSLRLVAETRVLKDKTPLVPVSDKCSEYIGKISVATKETNKHQGKFKKNTIMNTEDNEMNGYLSIASISEENLKKVALSIYYDKEMNILWTR